MIIILLFIFIWLMSVCVPFKLALFNLRKVIWLGALDVYKHYKYHLFDWYEGGYVGSYDSNKFGGGKTLSGVAELTRIYHRYNNKRVYDEKRGQWVLQKIHILSNIEVKGVSCEILTSMQQLNEYGERNKSLDEKEGTRTVMITFIDEAGSQLNSRSFRSNFDWDTLNTVMTARHLLITLMFTAPKHSQNDKLLREITQEVVHCRKIWRFVIQKVYDPRDVEVASSYSMLEPLYTTGFFATNEHYGSYDTLALMERLKKSVDENDMLTDEEILALRGELNPNDDAVNRPSKKLKRMRKKG